VKEPWPRGRSRHGGIDRIPLPPDVGGSLWLAGKRYVAPDPVAALESVGASVMACLCEPFELEARYPGYVAWLRAVEASGTGAATALWRPVPDLHAPPVESARALVAELAAHLDRGAGVLMHCGAGMGRAGTMAVAVLLRYGRPLEDALGTVAGARPGAGPEVGAQSELLAALAGEGPGSPAAATATR
jgi:hypothetical protein